MLTDRSFAYLCALLRLAVDASCKHIHGQILTQEEWRKVYHLSQKHAVTGVAWEGVECMQQHSPEQVQSLPPDLLGKWFADTQTIRSANRCMAEQAANVLRILRAGGFDAQIIKGSELAAFYPEPSLRLAADIDVWVLPNANIGNNPSDLRRALLAYLQQQPDIQIGEVVYHHIETTFYGTEVELHITPTWLYNPLYNSRLQQTFARERHLSPELLELYTLLHAFRHLYHDGLALRHVLDYYLVAAANRKAGVPVPDTMYEQLGLSSFARAIGEVTAYCLGGCADDESTMCAKARHILAALPQRRVSKTIHRDYPQETFFRFPWRTVHHMWRKVNRY